MENINEDGCYVNAHFMIQASNIGNINAFAFTTGGIDEIFSFSACEIKPTFQHDTSLIQVKIISITHTARSYTGEKASLH
jgi:hypothetical protein